MKQGFLFLFLFILTVSCQQPQLQEVEKTRELPSYFCSPELEAFFSGPDSLPVINFKSSDSFEAIESQFLPLLDSTTEYIHYKIPLEIDSTYKPSYLTTYLMNPNITRIPCFNKRNVFEIRVNSNDQILAEGDYIYLRELKAKTFKYLINYGKDPNLSDNPLKINISLKWDTGTSQRFLNAVLRSIVMAYKEAINQISLRKFKTYFCLLNQEQMQEVLKEIKFSLNITFPNMPYEYGLYAPPPPALLPPPPKGYN